MQRKRNNDGRSGHVDGWNANITELLNSASCPQNCDYFRIDIDGYDGVILRTTLNAGFRPKVIQNQRQMKSPEEDWCYNREYARIAAVIQCGFISNDSSTGEGSEVIPRE